MAGSNRKGRGSAVRYGALRCAAGASWCNVPGALRPDVPAARYPSKPTCLHVHRGLACAQQTSKPWQLALPVAGACVLCAVAVRTRANLIQLTDAHRALLAWRGDDEPLSPLSRFQGLAQTDQAAFDKRDQV